MSDYSFQQVIYRCISPLHVGCGQDVGIVDLPITRERTTAYPYVPGSGIRGPMRNRCEEKDAAMAVRVFGNDAAGHITSGCLSVVEARILLFPVRSSPGVFHWLTCPFVLNRYKDDMDYFVPDPVRTIPVPQGTPDEEHYWGGGTAQSLFLEEYPFTRGNEGGGTPWTWQPLLPGVDEAARVLLVHDVVFSHFVRNATIVTQHNRLSSAKTVVGGQLFSVEACPPESVFYGFLGGTDERVPTADRRSAREDEDDMSAIESERPVPTRLTREEVHKKVRECLTGAPQRVEAHLILGGDESTGLGLAKLTWKVVL